MCERSPSVLPRQPVKTWRAFRRHCSSGRYTPAGRGGAGVPLSEEGGLPVLRSLLHPPLLHQAADDAQRVMDGALRLLDHQLVGASHHDAHRLPRAGAACDLHGATPQVYRTHKHSDAAVLVRGRGLTGTLTSFPEPSRLTSSASSAVPSISGVKWSMWAMGLVPMVCGGQMWIWGGGLAKC